MSVFDAFISYSQKAHGKLAAALRDGLHKFAKPLFKRRAIRVFRDQSLAIQQKLADHDRSNPDRQRDLSVSYESLAQSAHSEERGIPKRDHLVRLPAVRPCCSKVPA